MGEGEHWVPRGSDPLAEARRALADPVTGVMKLRHLGNYFFGNLCAWAAFVLAAVAGNWTTMHGPDPVTVPLLFEFAGGLFIFSIGTKVVLARPFVTLVAGHATVRNPLRVYAFSLDAVDDLRDGLLGFPTLSVGDRRIRLMGVQETLRNKRSGGSMERFALEQELQHRETLKTADVDACSGAPGPEDGLAGPVHARLAIFDWGLMVLLAAWIVYLASFFAPLP